jgi:Major Facilitator Superfamily
LSFFRRFFPKRSGSDDLLRNSDFRRHWAASVFNGFGGYITGLAFPLCAVLLLHASPAEMGILSALTTIPAAILALPSGVILDRNRKLPILLGSKIIQAVSIASIPVAYWMGLLTIDWMYATALVTGACNILGGGAEQVFLTNLIGRTRLTDAQSKFAATDSASRLLAPGIAGLLIQWLTAPYAMVVNAATFIASIALLRKIAANDPKPPPSDQHPLRDIGDGCRFIWRHALLRALAFGSAGWHFVFFGYAALSVLYATRELGMSPGELGAAHVVGGIGVLVSSMLLKSLIARHGPGGTMAIGAGLCTLAFTAMPLIPAGLFGNSAGTTAAASAVSLVLDCGVMLFLMPYTTLRQKVTPDAYLGRMISTMRFLSSATAPLGALTAGYLAEHFTVRTSMGCMAAGGVILTIALATSSTVRTVPQNLSGLP